MTREEEINKAALERLSRQNEIDAFKEGARWADGNSIAYRLYRYNEIKHSIPFNIYISTPINGRKEKCFYDKFNAAKERVEIIKQDIKKRIDVDFEVRFLSTFDINKIDGSEALNLGNCVKEVVGCNAIYMDEGWEESKGCFLELSAAYIYNLVVFYEMRDLEFYLENYKL